MKNIRTLIRDIYETLEGNTNWFTTEAGVDFARNVTGALSDSFEARDQDKRLSLRLSQMGAKCPHQLWSSIHTPSLSEPLPAWVRIKFAYGHILEALVISMAKAAGHEVTGEQDVVYVDGVAGHRDCVIDGCIVDVKSSSSRGFQKFKDGTIGQSDSFGYLDQLDGYLVGSLNDDLVRVKDRAFLLAVDKTLGHLALYEHRIREENIRQRIKEYKRIIELSSAPACTCAVVPDGVSGNLKLGVNASYNSFKHTCAESKGIKLRTFLYADGPRYLTKVVKRPAPHIVEVDKHGKVVYNG